MANEIQAFAATGKTLYAVLLNAVGQVYNGTTFVAINGANWTSYDLAMTEAAAGIYTANMPAVSAGTYQFVVYEQAGASPAITDSQTDTGTLAWAGSAVAAPAAATSYASVTQFRAMMTQAPSGDATDALIQGYLDRATAMIDGELGFSFAAYGAVATDKDFRLAQAREILYLPMYSAGSITHVYELNAKGTAYESTTEVLSTEYDVLDNASLYRYEGWRAGWYRVTAIWGYGAAPADIQQVCLEKAINLFIGAQGGQFSDVVGVEGAGAVGYNRAWTNSQRAILQQTRIKHGVFGVA